MHHLSLELLVIEAMNTAEAVQYMNKPMYRAESI